MILRLYVEGHRAGGNAPGYLISREWSDRECSELPPPTEAELAPVRVVAVRWRAFELVRRWNRLYATH